MDVFVAQFTLYILILMRVASLVVAAPFFGGEGIPVHMKVGLSLFLSFVMFPLMASQAGKVDVQLAAFALMVVGEVMVGLMIGFAAGLLFAGVRYAGEIIALHMGLSFANIIDPESGQSNPAIGQFLYLSTMLVFLVVNGHHFLLEALYSSYSAVPMGSLTLEMPLAHKMIEMTGAVFITGAKFAAPIIVAVFLNNCGLAVLSRVMPQMNVFTVSFSVNIGVGLLVMMVSTPLLVFVFKKTLMHFEETLLELVKLM